MGSALNSDEKNCKGERENGLIPEQTLNAEDVQTSVKHII